MCLFVWVNGVKDVMLTKNEIIKNSIIVVAHPDDEVIWMSSIVGKVSSILICYQEELSSIGFGISKLVGLIRKQKYRFESGQKFMSEIGLNREKALRNYPLKNVKWLGVDESGSYGAVDWGNPKPDAFGVRLDFRRESEQKLGRIFGVRRSEALIKRRYAENFDILRKKLKSELKGVENVFTHNPWGEYGHPDHIQVNKVLSVLQEELGFNLYVTTYCSHAAMKLAYQYLKPSTCLQDYVCIETDKALAREIVNVYKNHNCWTYHDDWGPMDEDIFIRQPSRHEKSIHDGVYICPIGVPSMKI